MPTSLKIAVTGIAIIGGGVYALVAKEVPTRARLIARLRETKTGQRAEAYMRSKLPRRGEVVDAEAQPAE